MTRDDDPYSRLPPHLANHLPPTSAVRPPAPPRVSPTLEQTVEMRMRCVEAVITLLSAPGVKTDMPGQGITPQNIAHIADHFLYFVLRGEWPREDA